MIYNRPLLENILTSSKRLRYTTISSYAKKLELDDSRLKAASSTPPVKHASLAPVDSNFRPSIWISQPTTTKHNRLKCTAPRSTPHLHPLTYQHHNLDPLLIQGPGDDQFVGPLNMSSWPSRPQLFLLGVSTLIAFLSYSSQYLFRSLEPPLERRSLFVFNLLVACIWICYYRACTTDPGGIPRTWDDAAGTGDEPDTSSHKDVHGGRKISNPQRWCAKCEMYKPPRAHHCKECKKFVLRSHIYSFSPRIPGTCPGLIRITLES